MSLAITIDNTKYPVAAAQIDSGAERFAIHSSRDAVTDEDKALCFVRTSLNVSRADRNHDDYGVALFTHRSWPESQVFSLKEEDSSVGLIFSMEALRPGSTVLQDKPMWEEYGFIALSKLCLGDSPFQCEFRGAVRGETYDITNVYTEDTVVAVLMKRECHLPDNSEKEFLDYLFNRLPGFAPLGLFLQIGEGSARVRHNVPSDLKDHAGSQTNIRLKRFSSEFPVSSKQFLTDLLLQIDPYEDHPTFRFFLSYQVIESLLQEMFEEYYAEFVRLATTDASYRSATAMKDLVDLLHGLTTEKNRLRLLVATNVGVSSQFGVLRDHCENLLGILDTTRPSRPLAEPRAGAVGTGPTPPVQAPAAAAPSVLAETGAAVAAPEPTRPETPAAAAPAERAAEVGAPRLMPPAGAPAIDPAAALYSVRNILFHNFRKVVASQDHLEELVDQFSQTICELAVNFKRPPISLLSR